MESEFIIVGAGIGGLAAALALSRIAQRDAGPELGNAAPGRCLPCINLLEQADEFSELGAGLQLGPNAVRVLHGWGLGPALDAVAARPEGLRVLDAQDGRMLGAMRLGASFRQRYGSDYLTLHRADLHRLLRQALLPGLDLQTITPQRSASVVTVASEVGRVVASTSDGKQHGARGLLACDGLWSIVRQQIFGDGPASATGHLAYRAMLDIGDVPAGVARDQVSVWLGPHMHAVAYPVRLGVLMNLVVIVHPEAGVGRPLQSGSNHQRWDIETVGNGWLRVLHDVHPILRDLTGAVGSWRLWTLHDRPELSGPHQMACGRVALLGDAAHPMRPYLAQGAAMALEDAAALAEAVQACPQDLEAAFQRYARRRWRRNARVQRKSRMNGRIFHADGALRTARDFAMRLAGERLLDAPWLYGYRGAPN